MCNGYPHSLGTLEQVSACMYRGIAIVEEGPVLYTNCSLGPGCLAFIAVGVSTGVHGD